MEKRTVYAAPAGAPCAAGTENDPIGGLAAALSALRAAGGGELVLRGGTYFLPEPLCLGPEDSGLVLRAYPGETPVLTGAMPLDSPVWRRSRENSAIFVTQTEKHLPADMLFWNGIPQTPARWPDLRPGAVPLGGAACAEEIRARSARWAHPETGHLRALHDYGWGGNDYFITGRDESDPTGLRLLWVGDNNRGSAYMQSALVAENLLEELDAPGEWFYDAEQGLLYFWPPEELRPEDEVSLGVHAELLRIAGTETENVCGVRLENLSFARTARTLFSGLPYRPLQRADWAVQYTGAVYVENARELSLSGCSFAHIGGNALFFCGSNSRHTVERCTFSHIGATGVQIVGDARALRQPSYWPNERYPDHPGHETTVREPASPGPAAPCYARGIALRELHIEDVGIWEKQSACINLAVCSRVRIEHCTLHHSARSCINVCGGAFGGHEIAYNDIFDAQTETMDHGPFNAWGRDRFWSVPEYGGGGEHGAEMRHYRAPDGGVFDVTLLDAAEPTELHHNRFFHAPGAPHTWGIDLDDGASNYEVHHNLCMGLGIKLREGFSRRVYNNLIVGGRLELHVPYDEARDRIYSNLIVNPEPFAFAAVDAQRLARSEDVLENNWVFSPSGPVRLPAWFDAAVRGQNPPVWGEADPNFADPEHGDYTVQNREAMRRFGFENLPMSGYGAAGCACAGGVFPLSACAAPGAIRREAWNGALLSEVDDTVVSSTGSFGKSGVYFESVPPESGAYRIGFRTRDVLKKLGGRELAGLSAFYDASVELRPGEAVRAELHRKGSRVSVTLTW